MADYGVNTGTGTEPAPVFKPGDFIPQQVQSNWMPPQYGNPDTWDGKYVTIYKYVGSDPRLQNLRPITDTSAMQGPTYGSSNWLIGIDPTTGLPTGVTVKSGDKIGSSWAYNSQGQPTGPATQQSWNTNPTETNIALLKLATAVAGGMMFSPASAAGSAAGDIGGGLFVGEQAADPALQGLINSGVSAGGVLPNAAPELFNTAKDSQAYWNSINATGDVGSNYAANATQNLLNTGSGIDASGNAFPTPSLPNNGSPTTSPTSAPGSTPVPTTTKPPGVLTKFLTDTLGLDPSVASLLQLAVPALGAYAGYKSTQNSINDYNSKYYDQASIDAARGSLKGVLGNFPTTPWGKY